MEENVRRLWKEVRELNLGTGGNVDRLEEPPSSLRFLRDYVSANKPCLVSSKSTNHWPALSTWEDDEYLCKKILSSSSDSKISVHLTPHGRADSLVSQTESEDLCFASACVMPMNPSEALRLIASTGQPDSDIVAYAQQQNDCFRSEYGGLAGDVDPHILWATEALGGNLPEAVNLWIGNGRSHTSYHRDHYENLYVVLSGEKHFLLLPPTDVHRLYIRSYPSAQYYSSSNDAMKLQLKLNEPRREVPWCSVDPYPSSEEEMALFPLYFDGPEPFRCTVKAGEILYLPRYDMQFDIKYAYFNFLQSVHLSPPRPSCSRTAPDSEDDADTLTIK